MKNKWNYTMLAVLLLYSISAALYGQEEDHYAGNDHAYPGATWLHKGFRFGSFPFLVFLLLELLDFFHHFSGLSQQFAEASEVQHLPGEVPGEQGSIYGKIVAEPALPKNGQQHYYAPDQEHGPVRASLLNNDKSKHDQSDKRDEEGGGEVGPGHAQGECALRGEKRCRLHDSQAGTSRREDGKLAQHGPKQGGIGTTQNSQTNPGHHQQSQRIIYRLQGPADHES